MDTYDQKQKERFVMAYWRGIKLHCLDCGAVVVCKKVPPPNQIRWLLKCECERCGKSFEWTPDEDDALRKKHEATVNREKKKRPKPDKYI